MLRQSTRILFIAGMLAITACGGGGGAEVPNAVTVGVAGGTVVGPNGTMVVIPAGALASNTTVAIERTSIGAPPLPAGHVGLGSMFAFTPHGTAFAAPVTMTLPFDATAVPAGRAPQFYKTNASRQWEQVANATFGAMSVTAQVGGFSFAQVVVPPLQRDDPVRNWEFQVYPGNGQAPVTLPGGSGTAQVGELVDELATFGPSPGDPPLVRTSETLAPNLQANGLVISTPDGVTYSVYAEAPDGKRGGADPIGSSTRFTQSQSYIKRAVDATLSYTVTKVSIALADFNRSWQGAPSLVEGGVSLMVKARRSSTPGSSFYSAGGFAWLGGQIDAWVPLAEASGFSRTPLWSIDDFDFVTRDLTAQVLGGIGGDISCLGRSAQLLLKGARTYHVDLSSVPVGEEFSVDIETSAITHNQRGGGSLGDCQMSSAQAGLRDPLDIGGATLAFTGLEPTNRPLPAAPGAELAVPAACQPGPGPDPASGVLQFGAAAYTVDEWAGAVPSVTVVRSGGSKGAVSAAFATSDGSGVAGIDYVPVSATVFFADGDVSPRIIPVSAIPNQIVAPDKTVNLRLSQPGGCAGLGPQATSVLTIRDDRRSLPPSTFTLGGTITGLAGSGLVLDGPFSQLMPSASGAFVFPEALLDTLPYTVRVRHQPENPAQVCTVTNGSGVVTGADVTDVQVDCVTTVPVAGLDASFGANGQVGIANPGGVGEALALQPDGKIIVAASGTGNFTLLRLLPDGTLDTGFGSGGSVSTDFGANDDAYGVALQPDGRIVVVGRVQIAGKYDFGIARYEADGRPDAGFGSGGKLNVDFAGGTDYAHAVVIQPDGRIVVGGQAAGAAGNTFALVRLAADGSPDPGFGAGGKVQTAFGSSGNVAYDLALAPDGKLVLAGYSTVGIDEQFTAVRYGADGSLDTAFGAQGIARVPVQLNGRARAVQVLADGSVLMAGGSAVGFSNAFGLVKLSAQGQPDTAFGSGGVVIRNFSGGRDYGRALAVQADGRIVVAGSSDSAAGYDVALLRVLADGTPDAAFGTGGVLQVDHAGGIDLAYALALQPDGRIVAAGQGANGPATEIVVLRVLP